MVSNSPRSSLRTQLPRRLIVAHELALRGQFFDQQGQIKKAMLCYLASAKLFTRLLKLCPQMAYRKLWVQEAKLCLSRIRQLADMAAYPPPDDAKSSTDLTSHNSRSSYSSRPLFDVWPDDRSNAALRSWILSSLAEVPCAQDWNHLLGLEAVVAELRQALFQPLMQPDLPQSSESQVQSILLFGPSGCGKSHLIRVLATQSQLPVFCLSVASLLAKWPWEPYKLVQFLYKITGEYFPAILFLDDIDPLLGKNSPNNGQIPVLPITGFLKALCAHLSRSTSTKSPSPITIVATRFPWVFEAALFRFDRVLYIPLPSVDTIFRFLTLSLDSIIHTISEQELRWFAYELRGYSIAGVRQILARALYASTSSRVPSNQGFQLLQVRSALTLDHLTQAQAKVPRVPFCFKEPFDFKGYDKWNVDYGKPPIDYSYQPDSLLSSHLSSNPIILDSFKSGV